MLPLPNLLEHLHGRILSNAVIQGSFSAVRRNYDKIFSDLVASLNGMSALSFITCLDSVRRLEDPEVWGTWKMSYPAKLWY